VGARADDDDRALELRRLPVLGPGTPAHRTPGADVPPQACKFLPSRILTPARAWVSLPAVPMIDERRVASPRTRRAQRLHPAQRLRPARDDYLADFV
jgi:hypothetical protein